jgi:putative FmdB family regulatory protein
MPLSVYRCPECGAGFQTFELQGEDSSGSLCPSCRAGKLERVSTSGESTSGCATRGKRYR